MELSCWARREGTGLHFGHLGGVVASVLFRPLALGTCGEVTALG